MKTLKFLILIICSTVVMNPLFANGPKWKITGTLLDVQSQTPISYATILLNLKSDSSMVTGAISDDSGDFILEKVQAGDYFIKISFIGYQDIIIDQLDFDTKLDIIELGPISMQPSSTLLDAVEVTAKAAMVKSTLDKQVLAVDKNIATTGGTAADALKIASSVKVAANGQITLRGSEKFMVLINGKPTALSPQEVLKQTPANHIASIEIITNPSVKYSAEGGAGIINIILKKEVSIGLNGNVNIMVGSKDKYSCEAGLNLNREKLSLSAGIEWRDYTQTALNNYDRRLVKNSLIHLATMDQDRTMVQDNLGVRFGLNLNPNPNNSLTYSMHAGRNALKGDITAKTSGGDEQNGPTEFHLNRFNLLQRPTFFTNNLNYSKQLKNGKTSIAMNGFYSYIDYLLVTSHSEAKANHLYEVNDSRPYLQNITNDNYSHDIKVDLDITHPFSEKSSLEAGANYRSYSRFLDVSFAQYNHEVSKWTNHPAYTNRYDYQESIYGIYANVNHQFGDYQLAAGLRVEYMDRLLDQNTSDVSYPYDKWNMFPSLSLSRSIKDVHQLRLSISNRINRPDEYAMNPFPEFEDNYFSSQGNPYLVPEIIRSAEFGYKHIGDKVVLSSALYVKKTYDKIDQKLSIGDQDKIHTIYHNDVSDQTIGLELSANSNVTSWWSIYAGGEISAYRIKGIIEEQSFNRSNHPWSVQMMNNFQIKSNTSVQVTGHYNSETERAQGKLSDYYAVDLAIAHKFFNGKLKVNVQCKDVLQTLNYKLYSSTNNMNLVGDFINESPIFLFSVSYQFSDYKKLTKDVQTKFDM